MFHQHLSFTYGNVQSYWRIYIFTFAKRSNLYENIWFKKYFLISWFQIISCCIHVAYRSLTVLVHSVMMKLRSSKNYGSYGFKILSIYIKFFFFWWPKNIFVFGNYAFFVSFLCISTIDSLICYLKCMTIMKMRN